MGSGKSAVAKQLAKKLCRKPVELDALIEAREKKSISEIFEKKGEPYFRRLERKLLKETFRLKNRVISTGGGVILNPLNVKEMKKNGILVCLTASIAEIKRRTGKNKKRPLLAGRNNSIQSIQKRLKYRRPMYQKAADIFVSTTNKTATASANQIIKKLGLLK